MSYCFYNLYPISFKARNSQNGLHGLNNSIEPYENKTLKESKKIQIQKFIFVLNNIAWLVLARV